MLLVFSVFLTILAILFVFTLKDCIIRYTNCKRCGRRIRERHSPKCQNFTLRFFYEFILEFCICVALELSVQDFTEFSPTLYFCISVALLITIFGLIAFITTLFLCKGPWIPGFYTKGTSLGSVIQVRKRNRDFNADEYLKTHPIPQVKPWGSLIINIDLNKVATCFS